MAYQHTPVMLSEVMQHLDCKPGNVYVDGTLGGGGHAQCILQQILPGGMLIGIDQDHDAIANGLELFRAHSANIRLFHDNFVSLPTILQQLEITTVDGILLDLGISSHQLASSGRGFSFNKDEPLDMRMNTDSRTNAADIVNSLDAAKLAILFREYGEERWAKRIAQRLVQVRRQTSILTSRQLADIVVAAIPKKSVVRQKIHPATRVFMALRIAVNHELERLEEFLESAAAYLNPGGRLCILSFHSLEDRIVKQTFRMLAQGCHCPPAMPQCACGRQPVIRNLTRKAIRPSAEEVRTNPRARSTRLRAAEKR